MNGVERHQRKWTYQCETASYIPSKAEGEKSDAKDCGNSMPDQGTGMTGTEVEAKPEGSSQGKQLACHKINLSKEEMRR